MTTIGEKIKKLRRDKGMSQSELAEKLGVTSQAISKWEKDISQPDIQTLPNIAACFGVAIDDLFEYSKEKKYEKISNTLEFNRDITAKEFLDMENFLKSEIDLKPDNYKPINLLADMYRVWVEILEKKSFDYAKRALELKPNSKDNMTLIFHALHGKNHDWNIGSHKASIDFWKKILKAEPKNVRAYLYLLDDLMDAGRLSEAKEILAEARTVSKDTLYDTYEVQIEEIENGFASVIDKYKALAEKYPKDWRVLFHVANQFAQNEHYEEAIEYWLMSFEAMKKPRYTDMYDAIAQCYIRLGDKASAIGYYKKKKQLIKDDWGARYGYALDEIDEQIEELSRDL